MLYRVPQTSAAVRILALARRVIGALADLGRSGADEACLDNLRPEQLDDLGITRIEGRGSRYYR